VDRCSWEGLFISMTIFALWGLKNALTKFQWVMDWVLVGIGFAKCYIDDIIVFRLIPKDHILQDMYEEGFKEHNLKLHFEKC
jgi:hypothetical protein